MGHEPSTAEPPRSLAATLAHLGQGIILASSIVGSGELIATTTVGATAAAADRAGFARRISAVWVLVATGLAVAIGEPVAMVLASGVAQAIMLAALAVAVIWFRYRESDPRVAPGRVWDVVVWASAAGFLAVGLWTARDKLAGLLAR